MGLRVCIPAAGTGSRLGNETAYLNKSLVDVAGKPALARIIEQFPDDTEFVIALGYKGELVREFLSLACPDRRFYFADVSPYAGPGSGLGLSLLQCAPYLQQPFIFLSCDTLCREALPRPEYNWAGWCAAAEVNAYRTLLLRQDSVADILEKGHAVPGCQPYIGAAGIADYALFWRAMQQPEALLQGEACGLRALLHAGRPVRAQRFTWHDTGSPDGLREARAAFAEASAPTVLPKPDEAIWFVGERVIKFSNSTSFISQRVERAAKLTSFVPRILGATPHMYAYQKAEGEVLSRCVTPALFRRLLEHSRHFWEPAPLEGEAAAAFRRRCRAFYRDKTFERVQKFYAVFQQQDGATRINDQALPPLRTLLEKVDWDELAAGLPGRFHGDFHFENILWSEQRQQFTFLDWRQNFGGDLHTGDIYYDFAKLLHGLIISHGLIAQNLYDVSWEQDSIHYDVLRKASLVRCEELFMDWLKAHAWSVRKTRILTALIFLNIAALHHYPYSLLLYALGKDMLHTQLNEC